MFYNDPSRFLTFLLLGNNIALIMIINAGGTIAGGRYKNKSANILERRREIETLVRTIEQKEADRIGRINELSAIASELQSIRETMVEAEETARQTERHVMAKENEIKMHEASLDILQTGREKREKELLTIEREQAESDEAVENLPTQIGRASCRERV